MKTIDAVKHRTPGSIGRSILKIECVQDECLVPLSECHPSYCSENVGHSIWLDDGAWRGRVVCKYEKV